MTRFTLHPLALADYETIIRYSRRQWGVEQARRYGHALIDGMRQCADGTPLVKAVKGIAGQDGPIFVLRCKMHKLYFIRPQDDRALIIAILSQHMDQPARLAERMEAL
ncbi:type II toxin-antitoxin system RelE/ParE family toxin [Alterisphingorhabdus coralli]|uniref:Type II toxin-antitoxin system RelE/ParE family toxin n=1 Tax=Alterisphingorhabdus coralli TaxID=3071408 RepID=A0AA97F7T6_9SPHN|nr:type II toxin-antitoxin system RelE/ParE family toxin [Parasphingorhabdus sp. SCSIO 66989]WOE75568.1 type II toxin-antitoxin system RelE/ParE family toxin [Parasphingorhabdus sp. SCSIO 66989]